MLLVGLKTKSRIVVVVVIVSNKELNCEFKNKYISDWGKGGWSSPSSKTISWVNWARGWVVGSSLKVLGGINHYHRVINMAVDLLI